MINLQKGQESCHGKSYIITPFGQNFLWSAVRPEDKQRDLSENSIKVNIKSWYPGWLIKLIVRYKIKKDQNKENIK